MSKPTAYQYLNHPENLYGWLLDHRADLARAVGDDRWLALGIEHTRFYQPGERPRTSVKAPDEEEVIEDAVMTRVLSLPASSAATLATAERATNKPSGCCSCSPRPVAASWRSPRLSGCEAMLTPIR